MITTISLTHIQVHYDDVIMDSIASQITSLMIVYSTVHSGTDQRKHQSSASLAFVWEIHRWPVNFPHKWPVTRKMFPFDDVIMRIACIPSGQPAWLASIFSGTNRYGTYEYLFVLLAVIVLRLFVLKYYAGDRPKVTTITNASTTVNTIVVFYMCIFNKIYWVTPCSKQ